MGYTHYFEHLTATPEVIADARLILAATDVTVCGPNGQGLPIMNELDGIRLNGFAAADEDYETFHLRGTKEPDFPSFSTFCKTGRRPYDSVVAAILISAAIRATGRTAGTVRSDGTWSNWSAGVELFEAAVRPLTEDEKIALELDVERIRPAT